LFILLNRWSIEDCSPGDRFIDLGAFIEVKFLTLSGQRSSFFALKKFKQIPSLCSYLLTGFFDFKNCQLLHWNSCSLLTWLAFSKPVSAEIFSPLYGWLPSMVRIFLSPSYANRNRKLPWWKFLFNMFPVTKWFITHIVTFLKRI
jgi:hypothetical protein